MEEQLARSRPEEYPSLHPVHCPVFADQPVCGGRRMEMGPSGFLLKTLVTTHLDIRSYSSHAPSQGIKTNANTNTKSNTKAKTKTFAKNAKTKTSAKNAKTKTSAKMRRQRQVKKMRRQRQVQKCEDKDKCKKCKDKDKCKKMQKQHYTEFSYTLVVSCLLTNSKIVAKSL